MSIDHINHALVAETHPPMYLMHMYWARKPHNVVAEYIKHYSKEGEIVLDPFCGSGVAPIEAIKLGRRAIGIDINPMAILISRMTAKPIDVKEYRKAFKKIEAEVKDRILELYKTKCPKCGQQGIIRYTTWEGDKPIQIKYECSVCGRKEKKLLEKEPDGGDLQKLDEIGKMEIQHWYPKIKLYYPDGKPFREGTHLEDIDSISDLFTKRNLIGASILYNSIEDLSTESEEVKDLIKFTYTSGLANFTKMIPSARETSGPSWKIPRYWIPPIREEHNVWKVFEERFTKVMRGKTPSTENELPTDYKETENFDTLQKGKANIMWVCRDALETLRELPDDSIDYVFTDPTYGGSIQYGELCFLWASWLGYGDDYLEKLQRDEVLINEEQGKSLDDYERMLRVVFQEVCRVLKPGKYMTVTFHNPSFEIRNILERAAYIAGFDLESVVYQPPPAPSKKGGIQPYGSVSGDFYFRFKNVKSPGREPKVDEEAFERIIVQAVTRIIARRGEPTPMPIISNGIEPELCKHGFPFSKEKTIEKVIVEHVGKEFIIIDKFGKIVKKRRGISDKRVWFVDPEKYLLDVVPLVERVEKSVVATLLRRRKATFTDIMVDLYTRFKNALTPNPPGVTAILKEYAVPEKGFWTIKHKVEEREEEHGKIIALLAEIGKKAGCKIWIGRKEQSDIYQGRPLSEFCDFKTLKLPNIPEENMDRIRRIDVLWIIDGKVRYEFEVENTTSIVEAVIRGANIPYEVNRYVVIPEERENLLYQKVSEPGLRERIKGWKFIYYGHLEKFYNENKRREAISFADFEKIAKALPEPKVEGQVSLFEFDEARKIKKL
jgi:DNA modification methylase